MDMSRDVIQKFRNGTFGKKWEMSFDNGNKQLFSSDCEVQTISGGFLNKVYRLYRPDQPEDSVIVKHAPPFVKFLGREQRLGAERVNVEFLAMRRYHQVVPGSVPEMYFYDEDTKCVVMEDLRSYEMMSTQLSRGHLHMALAKELALLIARLHRATHIKTLSTEDFQEMVSTFRNTEMVTLNSDLTFTGVIDPNEPTNHCSAELTDLARSVRDDQEVLESVRTLNDIFTEQKECLTHGDLHLGSVMVDGCTPKVIDAEFASVGPAGADIGIILANYLFYYAANLLYPEKNYPTFCHQIREAIITTVEVYFLEARDYLSKDALSRLVSQTAGFTGCHIIKWMIGIAQSDLQGKPKAEKMCLKLGVLLTKGYCNITTTKDLLHIILETESKS
ncbi:methylthioribose kinase-like isoform X1 [Asterias amurensis]|uniref:methylthioribose kinase-like isoform X1 n=1 Tax=Asterias amurensis TaxID=7602 RepID=UPI003AB70852